MIENPRIGQKVWVADRRIKNVMIDGKSDSYKDGYYLSGIKGEPFHKSDLFLTSKALLEHLSNTAIPLEGEKE